MSILYHYTDHTGACGIHRDRTVNVSTKATDAFFGEGVYLTAMPPWMGKQRIIENNYDSAARLWKNPHLTQRADFYFRFWFDSEAISEVYKLPVRRDTWLCPKPISLEQIPCEFGSTQRVVIQYKQWQSLHYGQGPSVATPWYGNTSRASTSRW